MDIVKCEDKNYPRTELKSSPADGIIDLIHNRPSRLEDAK